MSSALRWSGPPGIPEDAVAAVSKTPSNTWRAIIRKRGWPTTIKTFRTKRDAEDWDCIK
jgi:hypothetical protein